MEKLMEQRHVKHWIIKGPDNDLIERAKLLGKELNKGKLSTSQIRQVFTKLKGIEAKGYLSKKVDFLMLKPLIAYAASRPPRPKGLQILKQKISWGIDEVVSANDDREALKRFKNFCRFFEAVLAYHKAAGGK